MNVMDKWMRARNPHPEKTTRCDYNNTALNGLQEIREVAFYHALRYRFDPVLSKAHEEYLDMITLLLKECGI